jgi:protein-disulfide isomerase
MRRYLPFVIIGAVFLIALGSGLVLFQWKQPPSAPTAPLVPVVPAPTDTTTPNPQDTPTAPTTPSAPAVPDASAAPSTPTTPKAAPARRDLQSPHIRGGANARVTIEEFGDFQCIPCAELFPTLVQVEKDYGERLRVVFSHRPLTQHEHATLAARAAEAAGLQGRFWEMHDLLFQNSARWTRGIDTVGPDASPSRRLQSNILAMEIEVRDVLATYAERLQLDVERFKTDMDSDDVKARVESDRTRGEKLGIDRTPTLYLNGHLLPAARRTVDDFHAVIDAELNGKGQAASSGQTATPGQRK